MKTKTALKSLPRIMTIGSVYEPVSRYLDCLPRRPTADLPTSLDCYLIHLVLEFSPRRAFAVDLACESTGGVSSIICLASPRVGHVSSRIGARPTTDPDARLGELIAEFAAEADLPGAAGFSPSSSGDVDGWESLARERGRRDFPVVLLPSSGMADSDGSEFTAILKAFPEAVILVLGNGRIGEDRSVQGLVRALHSLPDVKFWFCREHAPALNSSGVVMVADAGNAVANEIVKRLEGVFTTNYDFLSLVRDSCLYALDRGIRSELAQNSRASASDAEEVQDDPASVVVHSALKREVVRESLNRLKLQVQRLELKLIEEQNRSLAQSVVRRSARRVVHFGRRHRQLFAPKGSMRERMAKSVLQMGRGMLRS